MAEIIPQQILVPKKVYIGDSAELRCSFNIVHPQLREQTSTGIVELPIESFISQPDINDYVINKIQLVPTGIDYYQVVITFVPWKTGTIQFPPLKVGEIDLLLQPVQIVSIIEQNNTSTIKESLSPLLLPGTTYKLYGVIISLIILIILIIQLIIKRKTVLFFIKSKKLQHKYRKNKKTTIKNLNSLPDEKKSAGEIQKILRNYMEIRFDYPFTKCVTSELMEKFLHATQNLLGDDKNEAFSDLTGIFIRTDFIRYSENGCFNINEKNTLVGRAIQDIEILEREVEKDA